MKKTILLLFFMFLSNCLIAQTTFSRTVPSSTDDAEQLVSDGSMEITSSDLEIVRDPDFRGGSGVQLVGLRFTNITIPANATVTNAFITFRAVGPDGSNPSNSSAISLRLRGHDVANSGTFTAATGNISSRAATTAAVSWTPAAWASGTDYNTPNLSSVINEVKGNSGWASGNSLTFIINETSGTGGRHAVSQDDSSTLAPRLTVTYITCAVNASVSSTNINTTCGVNTGSISISNPTGASSGNYQYRLNSGTWGSTSTFSGLALGSYSVQIRDANDTSCTVTLTTVSISDINNDSDCDGVLDDADLDDDNDGILDSVECDGTGTPVSGGLSGPITNFSTNISSSNPSSHTVPHTLNSITVGGTTYSDFITPDGYIPAFTSPNNTGIEFQFQGTNPYNFSSPTWSQDILEDAFQTRNLNAYQNLDSSNYSDGDAYTLTYNTPKLINGGVFLAVTERNGNNPQNITALDVNNNVIGTINVLTNGAHYVDLGHDVAGSGGDNVFMALYPLEDFGPLGAQISSLRITFPNSTSDGADSKVFIFGDALLANPDNDFDNDGFSDCEDNDSDNDGIFDAIEANAGVTLAQLDSNGRFTGGVNADGVPLAANGGSGFTPLNTVGATNPNYINLDSDGDNCSDANEYYNDQNIDGGDGFEYGTGTPTVDSFGNVTTAPYNGTNIADTRDNTVDVCSVDPCDAVASGNLDTDSDGVSDICDLDDDNDGILDANEIKVVTFNGVNYTEFYRSRLDFGGTFGTIFLTSPTIIYSNEGTTALVFDGNSFIIYQDADNNGVLESFDYFGNSVPLTGINTIAFQTDGNIVALDSNGNPLDASGSNPNSPYRLAVQGDGNVVARNSTLAPYYATGTNNTTASSAVIVSFPNGEPANSNDTGNADGDSVNNRLDNDSDNDGIPDAVEAGASSSILGADGSIDYTNNGGLNADGVPLAANGGAGLTPPDSDTDGLTDQLDLDSDDDGIPDNVEAQTTQDYTAPNPADTPTDYLNNRGFNSAYVGGFTPVDTDGDLTPDYLDTDSDNDGLTDLEESFVIQPAGVVGSNGLLADAETADDYTDVNGLAYELAIFGLQDSDNDTDDNGSNAAPMTTDFDYRDSSFGLNLRVYLAGALINNGGATGSGGEPLMRDNLRNSIFETTTRYIPNTEPYTALTGFTHVGSGGAETATATAFDDRGQDSVVDWVFVEFRDQTDNTVVLETVSALVQRDGDVVGVDGVSPIQVPGNATTSYVTVRHRNHFGVMTAAAEDLRADNTVDFSDNNAGGSGVFNYGTSHPIGGPAGFDYTGLSQQSSYLFTPFPSGISALWLGNAVVGNKIKYESPNDDNSQIFEDVLLFPGNSSFLDNYDFAFSYVSGDLDMNGKVKYEAPNDDQNILAEQILSYPLNLSFVFNFDFLFEQLP